MVGVQEVFGPLLFLHSHENTSHLKKLLWLHSAVHMAHLLMLALSTMLYVNLDKSFYSLPEKEG